MKKKEYTIQGIRPLLLHNGRTIDPLDPFAIEKKRISAIRNKTEDDYRKLAEIEWEACLYWSDELGLYVPTDNLDAMLIEGAKKRRLGPKAKSGMFVDAEYGIPIQNPPGMPRNTDLEGMRKHASFRFRRAAAINKAKVMVTRVMVPTGWKITFTIEFDESLLNERNVDEMLTDAGKEVGVGTYRPKFGRFIVIS